MIFERSDGRIKDCAVPGSAAQEEISLMNDLDDHDRTKVSLEVAVITNCKWSVVGCQDLPDSRAGCAKDKQALILNGNSFKIDYKQ